MNKKKALAVILSCGLISAMALGGSLAYLTDNEAHTNTVQVSGNIRIDLVEEHWNTEDTNTNGVPDDAEKTVPNQEIPKDPKVINTGDNPTYVFLRMTVPVKDVTQVLDNGQLVRKDPSLTTAIGNGGDGSGGIFHEPQELFFFKRSDDAINAHTNHFYTPNEANTVAGWIRLGIQESNTETDQDGAYVGTNGNKVGQAVYVFGWNQVLAPRAETGVLYDKIQIKNIIENEVATDQIQNIKLEAFGIQSDNILTSDGTPMSTEGFRTRAELNEIYNIFVQQNGKVDKDSETNTTNNNGDFIWNTWQDAEHGQSQKEAHISNERDINNTTKRVSTTIDNVGATRVNYLVGQTGQVSVTTLSVRDGASTAPTYTSSNPEVASVNGAGLITANKAGDAMITVTIDGVSKSLEVHVYNDSRDQVPDNTVDINDSNDNPQGTTQP
jgi:predicted ribosomally synthesized peptide with SipW-like signal peptide